jgi:phosphoribosylformimino-5-aminoimidazole carboxamide ribotide isomerase
MQYEHPMFEIIPVIDLREGEVVHARMGQRADYRPISSTLCRGSTPEAVVGGLLGLAAFPTLYVADLDAIEGTGDNEAVLRHLRRRYPGLGLWVDAGFRDPGHCLEWLSRDIGDLVLGSETQADWEGLRRLAGSPQAHRIILSLDFAGDRFLGPAADPEPALWPTRVIVMTLARVGSGEGPDLARLRQIMAKNTGRQLYAAGGVRDLDDLKGLSDAGAAGVLVASALHDGRISREALASFASASA